LNQVAGFWLRPIDSLTAVRSPATVAGLTVYLAVPNCSVLLRLPACGRIVLEQACQQACA